MVMFLNIGGEAIREPRGFISGIRAVFARCEGRHEAASLSTAQQNSAATCKSISLRNIIYSSDYGTIDGF